MNDENIKEPRVIELLRMAEAWLFPAADPTALVALLQRSRRDLSQSPPDDYMLFLHQSDGAIVDGLMLYGSTAHHVGDAEIPELVEINLRRRAYRDDLSSVIQLGEIDDDIIGYQSDNGRYWRIDRSSGDCQEEHASFERLARSCLQRS